MSFVCVCIYFDLVWYIDIDIGGWMNGIDIVDIDKIYVYIEYI